jgi:hypothetical protein
MKKYYFIISLIIMTLSLTGCKKAATEESNVPDTAAPSSVPTEQPTQAAATPEVSPTPAAPLTIRDYYPFVKDAEYVYEGSGSEYASMNVWVDFNDEENNRIQTRTDNGGTQTVRVIENKDGKLSVITSVAECYYRDNFLGTAAADGTEVLLMEPLIKGTQWSLPNGSRRYISNEDVNVVTPTGNYQTLEVTTEGPDGITMDYYAPKTGLVKSVFLSGDSEISSTLKEIKAEEPFPQTMEFYYPNQDGKIYTQQKKLFFHTNDNTGIIIENAAKEEAVKDTGLSLVSANVKINQLYLGTDRIVHVDFSKEFTEDMNAGSGYEALILQSLTNTLGNYYGTDKVILTVEGKPYESGHYVMKENEAFTVNMDNVVTE